jgi:SAM-dependent methyltransferase
MEDIKTLHQLSLETDKNFVHSYIHVYESLLEPIRFTSTNVLEIGINTGNSHRMWRDYFPNANIYGLDIENFCNGLIGEERITAKFTNAYTEECIKSLENIQFDVIIDDGPHTLESQIFVVENYCDLLTENGILVIEDIPDINWIPILSSRVPDELKILSYGIDRRWAPNSSWYHDEIFFIIDKRYVK